jgi:hypothetical protein
MPHPRKPASPFRYFNSSPAVIRLVVMMYVRFPLSLRNVEELLLERGIHSAARLRGSNFGMKQLFDCAPVNPARSPNSRYQVQEGGAGPTNQYRGAPRWGLADKVFIRGEGYRFGVRRSAASPRAKVGRKVDKPKLTP